MMLNDDIEILEGIPLIYIKSINAVACSDLHLGYEGVMAKNGTFLPKANLRRIKGFVDDALEKSNAKNLILVGDIKNEFSEIEADEFNELKELSEHVLEKGIKLTIIKGNHDTFIDRLAKPLGITLFREYAEIGNYFFFHGDEIPKPKSATCLIMGHIHPAISLFNSVGTKEKLHCFLYGKTKNGKELVVLPAMNYFSEGTDVLSSDPSEMCPIFENDAQIEGMRVFCIGEGETLEFGSVEELIAVRE